MDKVEKMNDYDLAEAELMKALEYFQKTKDRSKFREWAKKWSYLLAGEKKCPVCGSTFIDESMDARQDLCPECREKEWQQVIEDLGRFKDVQ